MPMFDCCVTHPGISHEQHMDAYDKAKNAELLDAATALLAGEPSPGAMIQAQALLMRHAELELVRLRAKEQWLRSAIDWNERPVIAKRPRGARPGSGRRARMLR